MRPGIDAIAIDLDGTLLGRDGAVSARNIDALDQARRAGLRVVIATGRALAECTDILAAIGHDGPVIHAGGSMLSDAASGRTLERRTMDPEVVAMLTDAILDDAHRALVLKDGTDTGYDYLAVGDHELHPASRWWFSARGVRVREARALHADPHPGVTVRVGAVACSQRLRPLAERLAQTMGPRCELQHWSAVTETEATGSGVHLLEAFASGADKWSMFETWCRREGISTARTAGIGDGLNDVPLVRNAALGIAMGNADPRVAAVARVHAPAAEHDGVATAIGHVLSRAWAP